MFKFTGMTVEVTATDEIILKRWAKELKITTDELVKNLAAIGRETYFNRRGRFPKGA